MEKISGELLPTYAGLFVFIQQLSLDNGWFGDQE